MAKPSYTPGPWHRNIKPASRYPTIFAGRNTHIARIVDGGRSQDEIEANCNLIAAAPRLYEALKGFMQLAGEDSNERCAKAKAELLRVCPEFVAYIALGQQALAQAEGGSHA